MDMHHASIAPAKGEPVALEAARAFFALLEERTRLNIPPHLWEGMDAEERAASVMAVAAQHLVHAARLASAPEEAAFGFGIGTAQAVARAIPQEAGIMLASRGFAMGLTQGLALLKTAQTGDSDTQGHA
jgi:hypothetical protein